VCVCFVFSPDFFGLFPPLCGQNKKIINNLSSLLLFDVRLPRNPDLRETSPPPTPRWIYSEGPLPSRLEVEGGTHPGESKRWSSLSRPPPFQTPPYISCLVSCSPRFVMFDVIDDFEVLAEVMKKQASLAEGEHKGRKHDSREPMLKNSNFHPVNRKSHAYNIQQPR